MDAILEKTNTMIPTGEATAILPTPDSRLEPVTIIRDGSDSGDI